MLLQIILKARINTSINKCQVTEGREREGRGGRGRQREAERGRERQREAEGGKERQREAEGGRGRQREGKRDRHQENPEMVISNNYCHNSQLPPFESPFLNWFKLYAIVTILY